MNRTDAERLREARALIADRRHWTQSNYARLRNSQKCATNHPDAYRFCAVGALWRIAGAGTEEVTRLQAYFSFLRWGLAHHNDTHRHADILALYDRAIEAAEGDAP